MNSGVDVYESEAYEMEYDYKADHCRCVRRLNYRLRKEILHFDLKTFDGYALSLSGVYVTSTGRHIDSDGSTCRAIDFKKMVELQGGIYSKTINTKTTAVIVGSVPASAATSRMVNYAERRGIARIPYPLLCARVKWEISKEIMMMLGKCPGVEAMGSTSPSNGKGGKNTGTDDDNAQKLGVQAIPRGRSTPTTSAGIMIPEETATWQVNCTRDYDSIVPLSAPPPNKQIKQQ